MANNQSCSVCANTGLARATLVNKEVDGVLYHERIDCIVCTNHYEEAEKTMASFTIPPQVVGVKQPEN